MRPVAFAIAFCALCATDALGQIDDPSITPPEIAGESHRCTPKHANILFYVKQAHVLLCYRIEIDGTVKTASILKSSGNEELDKSAIECVLSWHYKPATKNGQPVAFPIVGQINWCIGSNPLHHPPCQTISNAADFKPECDNRFNQESQPESPGSTGN